MGTTIKKEKLKSIRADIDISQQELASLLNVSSSTIERWEREGAKESNSASWKNLHYLLSIYENKLTRNHLRRLLENQPMFLAQSFLLGLGPLLTVMKLESGANYLIRNVIGEYTDILEG